MPPGFFRPLDRRAFLTRGISAAALGAAGCARRTAISNVPLLPAISTSNNACGLPPVNISEDREIRTVVGLRPFRPSGFVVRAEKIGDTLVVHNYGHGGGGITLSWGTSRLAVDLARGVAGPAAVLGCGAVGLSCAMLLREAGYDVTIYAKDLPPQTTSNIAGGQWYPATISDSDHEPLGFNEQLSQAAQYAYRRYQIMLGNKYGVRWMRNYQLQNEPFEQSHNRRDGKGALAGLLPEFYQLSPGEHPFAKFRYVRQYDSLIIEPPIYLAAMVDELRIAGVNIQVRELHSREELQALPQKLIFNCTGLGARALFGDEELIPMKGQLTFLLPQPEVKYAAMFDDYYMFSRTDGVLLGGTHVRGDWSLEPDLNAKARIFSAHKELFGSFRACKAARVSQRA
jgi:glycine/D-amino acid oxidase-like deaminating enzyme